MGFFEGIKGAVRRIKGKLIVSAILVLVIIIWAIAPFSVALKDAMLQGTPKEPCNWTVLLTEIGTGIVTPLTQFKKCIIESTYNAMFFDIIKYFILFYSLFVFVGIAKAFPKHEYQDIENGSSDWCEGGEQYRVLHRNKGIVLAEKNYLPVDKRGNVNVLVVRRIWCW